MADDTGWDDLKKQRQQWREGRADASHMALEWLVDIRLETGSRALVKGMLNQGTCSLAYGDSGTGKSFLALDLALHIALGREWFGRKVTRAVAIYIAAEAGVSMRRRIIAFCQHHGLTDLETIPFALIASPINLLEASPDLPALIHEIEAAVAKFPDLPIFIVIDTLSRAMAGGNENAPDDMGIVVRHLDRIREATGAHVLVVHHTGKALGAGARGHSLLRAAMDTEIEISRPEGSKQSVALVTKQREEDIGASLAFWLRQIEIGHEDDGDPITSCVVELVAGAAETPVRSKTKPRHQPPEYLRAVDFLRDIVAELGKPIERPGLPNLKAVTLEQWREHLKKRGLYEPDVAGRSRFSRMKERLIASRLITVDADLVWPVPRPTAVITPFPTEGEP